MRNFDEELSEIKKKCDSEEYKYEIQNTMTFLSQKPLVLYGAGEIGYSVYLTLKQHGIDVACFCDKNKIGVHNKTGLPIITPNALKNEYADANIIICSVNYANEMKQELNMLGINSKRIFERRFLNLHEMTPRTIEPYLEGYERAYYLLGDEKSRQVLLNRIRSYLLSSSFLHSTPILQYFDPEIITLGCDEVFVDGGMYVGDTAEQFFKCVNGKYTHYYGFEPDTQNLHIAKKSLQGKGNITIIEKGLWSNETQLCFSGSLESSSKLDDSGNNVVEVTSLDTYFNDKIPPTFIKMDIEGAELEALKGSRNLIIENKPKLAICAYHKPEDLYTLPELIKTYCDDYKFFLRHYTDSIYETVLYAI
ncbi:MAG: FkbM family methyltransferase [Aminipila sp.]